MSIIFSIIGFMWKRFCATFLGFWAIVGIGGFGVEADAERRETKDFESKRPLIHAWNNHVVPMFEYALTRTFVTIFNREK